MMIWKNIQGYMGYQLNDEGTVRRVMTMGRRNGKNCFIRRQSVLTAEIDNDGRRFVYLSGNGNKTTHYLDDLLKAAFPEEFQYITKPIQSSK